MNSINWEIEEQKGLKLRKAPTQHRIEPIIEENKEYKNLMSNEALTSNQLNQMEEFLGSAAKQTDHMNSLMSPTSNGKFFFNNNQPDGVQEGINGVIRDFEELDIGGNSPEVELPSSFLQSK